MTLNVFRISIGCDFRICDHTGPFQQFIEKFLGACNERKYFLYDFSVYQKINMQSAVLLLIGIHLVYAGKHSLQYFYTATSGLQDFPRFVTVGTLDKQPFTYYDSNIRRETARQEWIAKSEGEDYWKRQTQISIGSEQSFMDNIDVAKDRFNHTEGVHTFQEMYGCEWDDQTGETNAFKQYGYDGEDFLFLDLKEMRWISPVQQGFKTKMKWNNIFLERDKYYINTECIDWLKKYLNHGKSSLEKTVSPQVSLLQKDPSFPVTCHATGFYPSRVTITWQKNEQDHDEDVDRGEIVPNEDGTFQVTSTLNIKPEEWKKNKFSCVVEHKGRTTRSILTEDEIKTNYESLPIGIIVGAVVAVIMLVAIGVAGYFVYQKRIGFKPVSASDDCSNSSTRTDPNA